jgi:hypothetical protein
MRLCRVLLLISALVLLGLVGAGMSHAHLGGVPTGGLMAPYTAPNDPPTSGLAAKSVTHIGGMAITEGDVHLGS